MSLDSVNKVTDAYLKSLEPAKKLSAGDKEVRARVCERTCGVRASGTEHRERCGDDAAEARLGGLAGGRGGCCLQ